MHTLIVLLVGVVHLFETLSSRHCSALYLPHNPAGNYFQIFFTIRQVIICKYWTSLPSIYGRKTSHRSTSESVSHTEKYSNATSGPCSSRQSCPPIHREVSRSKLQQSYATYLDNWCKVYIDYTSILRFLAQSYNEATRNTLLPVLLSAMRLVQDSCHSDPHQQSECVCKYKAMIRNLTNHFL